VPVVSRTDASPLEQDTADRIARVEHGLIPEVRIKGQTAGWSIEERLRVHHTPGVSIAVIHGYRVVWAKSYGVADAASAAPLTETTLMQAASISKMFTAMAALKDVERGKLLLDGDVNRALRTWHLPENELTRKAPVTLKELLSHTAGTNVHGFLDYAQDEPLPTLQQILDGMPPARNPPVRVELAPGTKFQYSGGGMMVVQQMLVDTERRAFPSIMEAAVLGPLGLSHSTFEQLSASDPRHGLAMGHDYDGAPIAGMHRSYPQSAAAGLWTTAADVAHLLAEIQLALEGRSHVLTKQVATRMTTPVISTGEANIQMAMGTFVEEHGGVTYFGHDGLNPDGFMAMSRANKKGDGAVVMANGLASTPLLMEVFRSIAAEYRWDGWLMPPVQVTHADSARLAALAGRYGEGEDQSIVITTKGDRLEVRQPFQNAVELLPVAGDEFVTREGTRFTFAKTPTGDQVVRTPAPWPPEGAPVTLHRMPEDAAMEPLYLLEAGHEDDALALYRKLLRANAHRSAVAETRFERIGEDLLYAQLDPKRALRVFEVNWTLHPDSPIACIDSAEALYRAGRNQEASPRYEKAQELFARDASMTEFERLYFRWKVQRLRPLKRAN
jgi:CubicO group peptidase (beta-lactamase class C family)